MQVQNAMGDPSPPSVYLGRHWHHSCDKIYNIPACILAYLQVIENWTMGRPGNEAIVLRTNHLRLTMSLLPRLWVSCPDHESHAQTMCTSRHAMVKLNFLALPPWLMRLRDCVHVAFPYISKILHLFFSITMCTDINTSVQDTEIALG